MQVDNKWVSDDEIEKSKQLTRTSTQRTRRHHFVPQMYLKRWADDEGKVLFTEIDTGTSNTDIPDAIANDEWFYQIVGDDVDPDDEPDLWWETHMSHIEDAAARWLRDLDQRPDGRIRDPNVSTNLAVFVALQSQRTPRRRAAELDITAALARFGARNVLDDRRVLPIICQANGIQYTPARHHAIIDEILAQPQFSADAKAKAIDNAIKVWRNHITPHLADRTWWLVSSAAPLATCDEPVILIGTPDAPRAVFPKFLSAPLVLFPIGPHRMLVATLACRTLQPPHALTAEEAQAVNVEIAANCLEFVYEQPGSRIAANLAVPPQPTTGAAQAATFWEAVLPPTRWHGHADAPVWPLQRWIN